MRETLAKLLNVLIALLYITTINVYADSTRLPATWTISGTITDGTNPIADVNVEIVRNGSIHDSTTTNASGDYSFTSLIDSDNYLITPTKEHYTFAPVDRTYLNLSNDINNAHFVGTLVVSIGGTITDGAEPLPNVTVDLTGDSTASTLTDVNGDYLFANLNAGATYTITPMKAKYEKFTPANRTYTDLSAVIVDADFAGTKAFAADLENIVVYPNPCKLDSDNKVVTFVNLTENSKIEVFSITGNLVFEAEADSLEYQWDLKNDAGKDIVSGLYIYHISNDKDEKETGKFVIIR